MNQFIDDGIRYTTLGKGKCNNCQHVGTDGQTCLAFPKGIPEEILLGEFDHHDSYPGDKGIQFKKQS